MALNKGLSHNGIIDKIYEACLEIDKKLSEEDVINFRTSFIKFISNNILLKSMNLFSKLISFFYLFYIKNKGNKKVVLQLDIGLNGLVYSPTSNVDIRISQFYFKRRTNSLCLSSSNIKEFLTYTYNMDSVDVGKQIKMFRLNLFYQCESLLVFSFFNQMDLLKLCINVSIIHGSFGILMGDVDLLNVCLKKAVIIMFKDKNQVFGFFNNLLSVILKDLSSEEVELFMRD